MYNNQNVIQTYTYKFSKEVSRCMPAFITSHITVRMLYLLVSNQSPLSFSLKLTFIARKYSLSGYVMFFLQISRCLFLFPWWPKVWPHLEQSNVWCFLLWFWSSFRVLKVVPQSEHTYLSSSLPCIDILCLAKAAEDLRIVLHISHINFSSFSLHCWQFELSSFQAHHSYPLHSQHPRCHDSSLEAWWQRLWNLINRILMYIYF